MPHAPFSRSNPSDPFNPRAVDRSLPLPSRPMPAGSSSDLRLAKGWSDVKARKPIKPAKRLAQHPRRRL